MLNEKEVRAKIEILTAMKEAERAKLQNLLGSSMPDRMMIDWHQGTINQLNGQIESLESVLA